MDKKEKDKHKHKHPSDDDKNLYDEYEVKINREQRERINKLVENYDKVVLRGLEDEYSKRTKKSDKVADWIAAFGGSWRFIIILAVFLIFWMVWNRLSFLPAFDPMPFILLNLLLSFVAAFQAPIIMMSQNRQAARDKRESVVNFAINYKAEREVDDMQGHLHRIEKEIEDIKRLLTEQTK